MRSNKIVRVTKNQLRRMIREELTRVTEGPGARIPSLSIPKHLRNFSGLTNDIDEMERMSKFTDEDWENWRYQRDEQREMARTGPMLYNGKPIKVGDTFVRKNLGAFADTHEQDDQLDMKTILKIDRKNDAISYRYVTIGPAKSASMVSDEIHEDGIEGFLNELELDEAVLISPAEKAKMDKLVARAKKAWQELADAGGVPTIRIAPKRGR